VGGDGVVEFSIVEHLGPEVGVDDVAEVFEELAVDIFGDGGVGVGGVDGGGEGLGGGVGREFLGWEEDYQGECDEAEGEEAVHAGLLGLNLDGFSGTPEGILPSRQGRVFPKIFGMNMGRVIGI
jgi:hypothetical protein